MVIIKSYVTGVVNVNSHIFTYGKEPLVTEVPNVKGRIDWGRELLINRFVRDYMEGLNMNRWDELFIR